MNSLFPQQRGGGGGFGFGGAPAGHPPIVEFRAGKCVLSALQPNGKHSVTTDSRRGKITLAKGSDGLMHFKWTNSVNNTVEDDRMVFAGEYSFKKVTTGRDGDRVYLLKYLSAGSGDPNVTKLMFWLQDKSTERDEAIINKVNECLTNPNGVTPLAPPAGAEAAAGASSSGAAGAGEMGGGLSQEAWMRMLGINPATAGAAAGGMGGAPAPLSGATPSAAGAGAGAAPFGNLDLGSILSALASNNANTAAATAATSTTTAPATATATATAAAAPDSSTAESSAGGEEEERTSAAFGSGQGGGGGGGRGEEEEEGDGGDAGGGASGSAPMEDQ